MKYSSIIFLSIITLTLSSCFEDRIDLDLNSGDNQKLAVEAWLTNADADQYVILTLTSDYLDSLSINHVDNAIVQLSYDGNTEVLEYQGDGKYSFPGWRAESGVTYTLDIDYLDESYTSTSTMRPMPTLENIRAELSEDYNEEGDSIPFHDILFDFQEIPGEGDGYYAVDYKASRKDSTRLSDGDFTNDDFLDGLYFADVTVTEVDDYYLGDTIILEAYNIGIEASDYLQDVFNEVFRGGPFDPPPVNVRSNISNGALGYFITSSTQKEMIVIK